MIVIMNKNMHLISSTLQLFMFSIEITPYPISGLSIIKISIFLKEDNYTIL